MNKDVVNNHECSENFYLSMKELITIFWGILTLFFIYGISSKVELGAFLNFGVFVLFTLPITILLIIAYLPNPPMCISKRISEKGSRAKIYIEIFWKISTAGVYATSAFFVFKFALDPNFEIKPNQRYAIVGFVHAIVAFILLVIMYIRAKAEAIKLTK